MEPGDHRKGFFARGRRRLGAGLRAAINRLPKEPPAPAPDGLRGLPEIASGTLYALKLKLLEIPGWFRPTPPASAHIRPAGPDPEAPRSTLTWTLRRTASVAAGAAAVMILWATLLAWLDPFGLNRNAEQYSEQLNARLEAPFYNSRAQGDIVMVLITPEALKHRGYAWPPRYEYYADTVRRVLYDAPRAVFVDVLVRQARVEDGTLAYAQRELDALTRENGIPVLFGTETPGARSLFSDAHGVDVAPLAWQGAGNDYPLRLADDNIVPWSLDDVPRRPLTRTERESVALRLYRYACPGLLTDDVPDSSTPKPLPGCNTSRGEWTLPLQPAPLVVQWGQQRPWPWRDSANPDPDQTINACFAPAPDPGLGWRITRSMSALLTSLRSGVNPDAIETTRERCPYTLTIAEHQLEDLPPGFLEQRIVIVATALPGIEDSVVTPVHRRIAGGYLHAMALDNLMHHGGDYRYRDDGKSRLVSFCAGLALCLALAAILRGSRHGRPVVRWALLCVAAVLVALGTLLALNALNLPAPNWVVAAVLFVYTAWRVTSKMRAPTPPQPGAQP